MLRFADFLAPFDADVFRRDYFGKRPVHINGPHRAPPLDWQRLNEALAVTPYWNEETLKLFFDGRAALRDNYCDTGAKTPAPANPAKVRALVGHGASLVANHIHKIDPQVGAVARMLEAAFAAKAGANVYCSFKDVRAFPTHYDLHDVFAVQTEGEKTWNIYSARADNPVNPVPPGDEAEKWLIASRGELLFQAHMKPGDILYLPRGQYHDAITDAENSMHITFWVKMSTGLSLFDLLERAAGRESLFRADLPDARDHDALVAHLSRLGSLLDALVTQPLFLTEVLNMQRGSGSVEPIYDLPVRHAPKSFNVLRGAKIVRMKNGVVAQTQAGETIELGATYPAVEWLLRQRFFSYEEALARHTSVLPDELMRVLCALAEAGVIGETELRR